jgi:transcriptional regulator with GAF, ATPase, and Fis domain
VVGTTSFRGGNALSGTFERVLWTGDAAAVSEPFKQLLLELAQERSLDELLPLITRRLAEHEDVALARLWLLAPGDQCAACPNAAGCGDRARCLHLVASAARTRAGALMVHRRLDGAFRRIPVGAFKVGLVAASGAPVVVADPARDPKIRRPDWVRAEGIAGFAGLPLHCRGELVGVLGVFVRTPISPAAVDVLRLLGNHAAAAITTARAFAQVETMRRQLLLDNPLLRVSARTEEQEELVGRSARVAEVVAALDAVAPTDATVLVQGESGTGKELVAQAIHRRSRRQRGPFVEVNCAAIPRELAESELFGHVKGAFSGAVRDRVGRFEAASGGTLFLDEVGELPLEMQGKLLRVIQEGTYDRVGEVRTRHADVRLIAATNRDLLGDVAAGRFRQDLYYRLAVYPIALPPLRARKEDLPELAAHLLARICRGLGRPAAALDAEQLAALARRDWPGNVRELRNVLEHAVITSSEAGPLRLPAAAAVMPRPSPPAAPAVPALEGFATPPDVPLAILSDAEMRRRDRENLRRALERCQGKIYGPDGAAALLGLKPTTLASRLKRDHLAPARAARGSG